MPDFITLFLNVSSVFIILVTAFFTWRNRKKHASIAIFRICVVMALWAVTYALEAPAGGKIPSGFYYTEIFLLLLSLPTVLQFCLRYTGLLRKAARALVAGTGGIQVVFFVLLVTNPFHRLLGTAQPSGALPAYADQTWEQSTFLFHALLSADCLLLALSLVLLLFFAIHVTGALRSKTLVIFLSLMMFIVFILLRGAAMFNSFPFHSMTVLLAFSCILALIAVLGYDMTSMSLFAYREIYKIMGDGVIVTNQQGEVVDFNPAIARTIEQRGFGRPAAGPDGNRHVGGWVDRFYPEWRAQSGQQKGVIIERPVKGKLCYYSFDIYPFQNPVSLENGSFMLIKDVTEQQVYNRFLKRQAEMDGLTGIFNRPAFDEGVTRQMKDSDEPSAILFFDIDLFKNVNDTYGHIFGDTVLKSVTACVSGLLRKDVLFGRVGGEEFAVFQHGGEAGRGQAAATAERLRAAIEAFPFLCEGKPVRITVSVGVACARRLPYSQLYRHADEMLYRAKNSGRNCVAVWEE